MKCEVCTKSVQFGHNVSHSKRRTNRKWRPNIQKASILVGNQTKKISICTRCLRTQSKVSA